MSTTQILRRLTQLAVFGVFVFLFLNTEYKDNDILPYAVNIFLRLDPLVAGSAMLADRSLIALVWPALIVVVAAVAPLIVFPEESAAVPPVEVPAGAVFASEASSETRHLAQAELPGMAAAEEGEAASEAAPEAEEAIGGEESGFRMVLRDRLLTWLFDGWKAGSLSIQF